MSASNPKARLNGIFQADAAAVGGNDSLRYTAPREPARQQQQTQQQATAMTSAATPEKASAIVYSVTVSLYQYDAGARKYTQVLNADASTTIGCVIVGSDASYNLLFYNAAKQHVCVVPIKFASFKPVLQPKCYVSFYDSKGVNWSVKFASDEQVADFMRQVFLTKIHVEIWGDDKSVTKTAPTALVKDDLLPVKDDVPAVAPGDTVAVAFSCWRVVGNVTCAPSDVVTKYAPFEKATDADLRKFRLGDNSERIKALDEGVVGMKKGGRRIILAPPGKTNGQDWYLIEVQLVKTKTGGSSSAQRRTTAPAINTATPPAAADASAANGSKAAKTPRRRSSPTASSSSTSNAAIGGDIVVHEDASQDELELKELRLLQREKQLEIQAKALEKARLGAAFGLDPFSGLQQQQQQTAFAQSPFGFSTPYGAGSLFSSPQQQAPLVSASGRPLDALIMELHAKVDYLIRNASAPGSSSVSASAIGGATDVSAVIRGVERLASENDRLLVQINSQNQQYVSYEKRCEELLKQCQQLQEEKRRLDDKYQSIASQQISYSSEIASLTSARDAAITQTNRLHAEYQSLLTAFYQKQQVSSVSEEQRNELNFEREARVRLERELKKETQTRALVEQELTLAKKQFDVYMKLKDTELQTQKQELEKQWQVSKSQEQKEKDDQLRQLTLDFQQQDARQQEDFRQQLERKDKHAQLQLETAQLQVTQLSAEKQQLASQLESANDRLFALEQELQQAATAPSSAASKGAVSDNVALGLADEEKQLYVQQIELLQQQVKELEEEKFKRVQDEMDSGRLGSPSSSPRNSRGKSLGGGECERCASLEHERKEVLAKEHAAARTLAMAQEIKHEAEEMMRSASGAGVSTREDAREKLTSLFKEAVNEMFFRFQDYFEEEVALDSKQVLSVIRKVLKQSTKDVISKLQEPEEAGDVADDDASDGPPAPPPLVQEITPAPAAPAPTPTPTPTPLAAAAPAVAAAAAAAIVAATTGFASSEQRGDDDDDDDDDDDAAAAPETKSRNASVASSAASDGEPDGMSLFMENVKAQVPVPRVGGHVSSDDDEDDDEFED